jgi:hypothetical protein
MNFDSINLLKKIIPMILNKNIVIPATVPVKKTPNRKKPLSEI